MWGASLLKSYAIYVGNLLYMALKWNNLKNTTTLVTLTFREESFLHGNLKYLPIYLFNLCQFLYLVRTSVRRIKLFEDRVWKDLSVMLFHSWQQLQKETQQKELCL